MTHVVIKHYQASGLLYGAIQSGNSHKIYFALIKRNGSNACTCVGWVYNSEPCSHIRALAEEAGATHVLDQNIENEDEPTKSPE